jgi:uncharacterized FlaG/YvyC family protein
MNDTNLPSLTNESLLLDPQVLKNLSSYEDYLSYYIQLDQASSAFSWLKADLLLHMVRNLGESSIRQLALDIRQPASTISNYTRVAIAFPPDKRDPGASFSIHFQASFADSLSEKTKDFSSENRFKWLEKAIDNSMSTRQLAEEIQEEKLSPSTINEEEAKMKVEAKKAVNEIKKKLDSLLREVTRTLNKDSYFEIIRIHQSADVEH